MTYHEDTTFKGLKGTLQFILSVNIQVVGRFVQNKDIIFTIHKETETNFCLLSS